MTSKWYLPVGNGMNREFVTIGETVWYDDAYGHPTKCIIDAVERSGRIWVRIYGQKTRVFFENHETGRLRSNE